MGVDGKLDGLFHSGASELGFTAKKTYEAFNHKRGSILYTVYTVY